MIHLCLLLISANADGTANEQDYKIVTEGTSTKLKSGAQVTLTVKIVALNGFHVSDEAPMSATLTPSAGLAFPATKITRDKAQKEPTLTTTFSAKEKGAQTVKGDLTFFLCTEKLCQRMTASRELAVTVN